MRSGFGSRLLLATFVMACGIALSRAQTLFGVVRFANDAASGVDAPFYDVDGITPLKGSTYLAMLYTGTVGSSTQTWTPVAGSTRPFRSDSPGGFWVSANVTLLGFAPGSAVPLQVRFWDSVDGAFATFEEAKVNGAAVGVSQALMVVLNGGFPPTPTPMTGLQSASLVPTLTLTRGWPGIVTESNVSANGNQFTNLCGVPVGANRWFRLASTYAGNALVTTTGSSIDTVMTAFRGSIVSPSALTPLACNDDQGPGLTASEVQFAVDANTLYLVCVAGKNGAVGTIQLNHTLATPLAIRSIQTGWVELSWPGDATNFIAESATDGSSSATWTAVTNTPVAITNQLLLQLNCATPRQMYRLRLGTGP